jgi:hypothetical protein
VLQFFHAARRDFLALTSDPFHPFIRHAFYAI